jgi:hypothetical protein
MKTPALLAIFLFSAAYSAAAPSPRAAAPASVSPARARPEQAVEKSLLARSRERAARATERLVAASAALGFPATDTEAAPATPAAARAADGPRESYSSAGRAEDARAAAPVKRAG